jgi:hypothetical protein
MLIIEKINHRSYRLVDFDNNVIMIRHGKSALNDIKKYLAENNLEAQEEF